MWLILTHILISVDVDSEREGGGTDSGLGSTGEIARDQTSSEGEKGPEIEFEEYKVTIA